MKTIETFKIGEEVSVRCHSEGKGKIVGETATCWRVEVLKDKSFNNFTALFRKDNLMRRGDADTWRPITIRKIEFPHLVDTWKSKLTKKELRHLKDTASVTTFAALLNNAKHQKELRGMTEIEPCWECQFINKKLGLPI